MKKGPKKTSRAKAKRAPSRAQPAGGGVPARGGPHLARRQHHTLAPAEPIAVGRGPIQSRKQPPLINLSYGDKFYMKTIDIDQIYIFVVQIFNSNKKI